MVDKSKANEVIEVNVKPLNNTHSLKRPPFDSPQITLKPIVSPVLLEQIKGLKIVEKVKDDNVLTVGQSCKNNSCKGIYEGPASDSETCMYHPGIPIFHEGMKYWSCCQKKTTEFSVFLELPGCTSGTHTWIKKVKKMKLKFFDIW